MSSENKNFQKEKQGFVLVTSYLLITVLSIFSLALFSRSGGFVQASERNKNNVIAFNMAESALDLAIGQLKSNNNYAGTANYVAMDTGNMQGGYNVVVCPPSCAGLTQPTDSNVRLIQATGMAPGNNTALRAYQTRTISSYVTVQPSSQFTYAVFAKDTTSFTGNALVDSYDSRNGAYNAATASSQGDVRTESTAAGAVSLNGNVTIRGNAVVGVGGNPASVITLAENSMITGTRSAATAPLSYPAASTSVANSGALTINGNTNLTLAAGTYHFTSIQITGNAQLTLLGAVTIYVDGNVKIAGNGVATSGNRPTNFLLYELGTATVQFSGNADIYAGIYAPNSRVKNTGNGAIFGAAICKDFEQFGNGNVHFDEALKDIAASSGYDTSLLSWVENNTSAGGVSQQGVVASVEVSLE